MKGTVSWVDPGGKPIGFIQPEGTNDRDSRVFFHKNMISDVAQKNSVGMGSEVNYTLGAPSDKGPRAATVEVLTAGAPPAPPTANPNPNPTNHTNSASAPAPRADPNSWKKVRPTSQDDAMLEFRDVKLLGIYLTVKIWVNFAGALVRCYIEGDDDSVQESCTTADGLAEFSLMVPKGWETNAHLSVVAELVYEGGSTSKPWRCNWINPATPPPQPATPVDDGKPNQLRFAEGTELFRTSRFTVTTSYNGTPRQGSVKFSRILNSRGLTNLATGERVNSVPVTWQTDDQGRLPVQVHCWGHKTEVDAELSGNPQTKQTLIVKGGR